MKKLVFLRVLFIATLFAACDSSSNTYWIDNPTNDPITVYIDDKAYDIPPVAQIEVDLPFGKHLLKYNDQALTFHNGGRTNNVQAILNPTQSTYIFYKQLFMNEQDERATEEYAAWALATQSDSVRLKINDTIVTVFVPFNTSNALFINKSDFDWNYNLDEPMPEGLTLTNPLITRRNRQLANDENYKAGKFQETLYKIYREQAFKDYLHQVSSDKVEFLLDKIPYTDLPKRKIVLTKINDISDTTYKIALEEAVNEFHAWLAQNGSNSTSGFKNVMMGSKLRKLQTEFLTKHPNDYSFNQAVNEFNEQINPFIRYQLNLIEP